MDRSEIPVGQHTLNNQFLCDRCHKIVARWSIRSSGLLESRSSLDHDLHSSVQQLHSSHESGCRICRLLWMTLSNNNEIDLLQPRFEKYSVFYDLRFLNQKERKIVGDYVAFDSYDLKFYFGEYGKSSTEDYPRGNKASEGLTHFYVIPYEYVNGSQNPSLASLTTASDECWGLVTKWYTDCTKNHKRCSEYGAGAQWYPTRLLDLNSDGDTDKISLCITKERQMQGPYLTLSHCWGTTPIKVLTKESLYNISVDGLSISRLAKTFQDTIGVARKLGIRYLWIDSLCILQDSTADWQNESSQMHLVYHHAMCNIAATGGSDSNAGLYTNRDSSMVSPIIVTAAPLGQPSKDYCVVDRNFWELKMKKAPLYQRAWFLQERLLAIRMLHFGSEQLFWECHELNACETFPGGLPKLCVDSSTDSKISNLISRSRMMTPTLSASSSRTQIESERTHEFIKRSAWCKVVTQYMRAALTMERDKVVAMSAIARRFAEVLNDRYLAGIWESHLTTWLLWSVCDTKQTNGLSSVRPKVYRAPSWSFFSIDAEIKISFPPRDRKLEATILDVHISLETDDPYGQISGGYILLDGFLLPAGIYRDTAQMRYRMSINGLRSYGVLVPDVKPVEEEYKVPGEDTDRVLSGDFYFLPLESDRPSCINRGLFGLILQQEGGLEKDTYQRWGYFHEPTYNFDALVRRWEHPLFKQKIKVR